jgi:hypothetical protein
VEYPVEETIARTEASCLPEKAKEMLRECYRYGRLSRPLLAHDVSDEDET